MYVFRAFSQNAFFNLLAYKKKMGKAHHIHLISVCKWPTWGKEMETHTHRLIVFNVYGFAFLRSAVFCNAKTHINPAKSNAGFEGKMSRQVLLFFFSVFCIIKSHRILVATCANGTCCTGAQPETTQTVMERKRCKKRPNHNNNSNNNNMRSIVKLWTCSAVHSEKECRTNFCAAAAYSTNAY